MSMNQRILPPYLVASDNLVVFVDGYTADNPRDWHLMVATRDESGYPLTDTARPARADLWPDLTVKDNMTKLIGNTQRLLYGIPVVR